MRRFFLPPDQTREPELRLSGPEAHHALKVLRLGLGDVVAVHNGAGDVWECQVRSIAARTAVLVKTRHQAFPPPPLELTLLQAIPKGKVFDDIIQKAAELGATRLIPLLSERSAVHLTGAEAASKTAKWNVIAREALKQSGAPWLLEIELPMTPQAFLAQAPLFDLALVASLEPDSQPPREVLRPFLAQPIHPGRTTLAIWVGPEGDFTPAEYAAIRASGARPISLGPLVLRCETAASYCLAIVNYEAQRRVSAPACLF